MKVVEESFEPCVMKGLTSSGQLSVIIYLDLMTVIKIPDSLHIEKKNICCVCAVYIFHVSCSCMFCDVD